MLAQYLALPETLKMFFDNKMSNSFLNSCENAKLMTDITVALKKNGFDLCLLPSFLETYKGIVTMSY